MAAPVALYPYTVMALILILRNSAVTVLIKSRAYEAFASKYYRCLISSRLTTSRLPLTAAAFSNGFRVGLRVGSSKRWAAGQEVPSLRANSATDCSPRARRSNRALCGARQAGRPARDLRPQAEGQQMLFTRDQ